MTRPEDFYWMDNIRRTFDDIRACCLKHQFSCDRNCLDRKCLIMFLTQLHISKYYSHLYFIFLIDKLISNLIQQALNRDKGENLGKTPCDRKPVHLENLVKAICSCGVSFSVWEKQNADGKGSGLHDFPNLMGPAKKILLEKLPSKLDGILSPYTSNTIIKIWEVYTMPFAILQ